MLRKLVTQMDAKCSSCDATLCFNDGALSVTCEYCGTGYFLEPPKQPEQPKQQQQPPPPVYMPQPKNNNQLEQLLPLVLLGSGIGRNRGLGGLAAGLLGELLK